MTLYTVCLLERVSGAASDDESGVCSFNVCPSGSVRTQYGIPETEPGDTTERRTIEETQPKERLTTEEENSVDIVQPMYMFREPLQHRDVEPQASRATAHVSQPCGGYPNLPEQTVTPIQAQSSLRSQSDRDVTDHEDNDDHDDNRHGNEDGNREVTAVDNVLPTLEEVIEIRDIHTDGEENMVRTDEEIHNLETVKTLILADLVLEGLKSALKSKTYIHIQTELDFCNASNIAKGLPQLSNVKSVILHCGFRHSKKNIDKCLEQDIKETINNLDIMYPEANIYLSAVLPCRNNKNRVKIDEVNAAIEKACFETTAEFLDYTTAVTNKETGKPDSDMYRDPVSLNGKGIKNIVKMMNTTAGTEQQDVLLNQLGIETRKPQDCFIKNNGMKSKDTKDIEDTEEKYSWFGKKSTGLFNFNFSGP